MSWPDFIVILLACTAAMLACRVIPVFVLKGRPLSQATRNTLDMIPIAAFAALVADGLYSPAMFDIGLWEGLRPLAAAAIVVVVALKSRNLLLCAVAGVAAYALLMLL